MNVKSIIITALIAVVSTIFCIAISAPAIASVIFVIILLLVSREHGAGRAAAKQAAQLLPPNRESARLRLIVVPVPHGKPHCLSHLATQRKDLGDERHNEHAAAHELATLTEGRAPKRYTQTRTVQDRVPAAHPLDPARRSASCENSASRGLTHAFVSSPLDQSGPKAS